MTGKPIDVVLREEILHPLGFQTLNCGVAEDRLGEVAKKLFTGRH